MDGIDHPTNDAGFLDTQARIIFMGGLNRQVVDGKWPGFREAFSGFDVDAVASMEDQAVDALTADDRVIKYRAKLQAVVKNARTMRELAAEHGSFRDYVDSLVATGLELATRTLSQHFSYVSQEGARHWLYSTGYDIGEVTDKIRQKYSPFTG